MDWIEGYIAAWQHFSMLQAQNSTADPWGGWSTMAAVASAIASGISAYVARKAWNQSQVAAWLPEARKALAAADQLTSDLNALNEKLLEAKESLQGRSSKAYDTAIEGLAEWMQGNCDILNAVANLRAEATKTKCAVSALDAAVAIEGKRSDAKRLWCKSHRYYSTYYAGGAKPDGIR